MVTNQNYNNLGQLVYQSAPYALSGAPGSGYVAITNWNTAPNYHQFYRDEVGRLTKDETRYQATVLWSNQTLYNVTQTTEYDALNHRRDTDSDAFGHLLAVTEYNVGSTFYNTFYRYNTQGNLTQVTDNAGNITTISYDLLGRKTAMTDPDMGSWQYQYDAVGNLTAQKDGRNQWVYLAYDDLNRLSNKRQDNPTTGALIADYTYDAVGQKGLLSFSRAYSAQGTTQITNVAYDTRSRLTQQTWSVPGAGGGSFRMDYAYNEANQKISVIYPGDNAAAQGEVVTIGYNAIGQLNNVSGNGVQYLASATYNAQGQVLQIVNDANPNGLTRQFTYETNTLRLSTIQAGNNATFDNLQKLTYAYDNGGNITTLADSINSGQKQCFQYDWLNRLTSAFTGTSTCTAYSASGTGAYNHSYTYDSIGNITSNAGNSYGYTGGKPHAVTTAFGNSYGYDANGNQTTRTIGGVSYTLTYDYENRLTSVSGGSISASFVYDADGNRVKGTVNGITTVYIAGVYEYQGGATTKYYEGDAMRRTGYASDNGVAYVLHDQLKSSNVVANQNGTLNGANYFYPYGGNRGGVPFNSLTTKRFTGQYQEKDLPGSEGLAYYNARWYDAQLGRFTSADTVIPAPGNPQAFNRYAYTYNNPLKYTDPSGHRGIIFDCECPGGGLGGGLSGSFEGPPDSGGAIVPYSSGRAVATITRIAISQGVNTFWAPWIAQMLVNHADDFAEVSQKTANLLGARYYVAEEASGLPYTLQNSIVNTIRRSNDPNAILAFRGRAPGSYIWDDPLSAKPAKAENVLTGPCGLRLCRVPTENGEYKYGVYVSDLDPAFAIYQGHPLHDDRAYMAQFGNPINRDYGAPVIKHGNFLGGWARGEPGATTDKLDDTVYLFNRNGYIGEGPMWKLYETVTGYTSQK